MRANKSLGKATSASKLEICASTVRQAVEVGVSKLKAKTVKALIDHLTGSIFLSDGSYCEPLSLNYCKALRALLGHPAHVEHLSKADWSSLSDFLLTSIENHRDLRLPESFAGISGQTAIVVGRQTGLNGSLKSNESSFIGRGKASGYGKQQLEQLLLVLGAIVSASNAPLGENAQAILMGLTRALPNIIINDEARQAAFFTINQVFARSAINCISASKAVMADLLVALNIYWSTKQMSLRDELIIMWIHCSSFIQSILQEDVKSPCRDGLENLLDTLKKDYGSRDERDQLHMENIQLGVETMGVRSIYPLQIKHMAFSYGATRKEEHWMVPSMISHIISLLDSTTSQNFNGLDNSNKIEQPKRRKINSHFQDTQGDLRMPLTPSRISGLQVLTFFLCENSLEAIEIQHSIESLVPYVSDADAKVSSWAMLALAR